MPEYVAFALNLPDDTFVRGYLECAEWCGLMPLSEDDDDGEDARAALECALRPRWNDVALAQAEKVCASFRQLCPEVERFDAAQAGHDLWLTRNHHGAGFWDGDYPRELGLEFTKWAHTFGEAYVYFDEDSETLNFS